MTETSINYAKALYELSVPEEAVLETEKIFRSTPQLKGTLENPLVSLKEKEQVIDRVFPQEMKNFLKVTCKYQKISSIYDILEAYGDYSRKQKGILKAVLTYVTKPEEAQKEKILEQYEPQFPENIQVLTEFVGDELEILDPYGGALQAYGLCYETLRKSIKKLVNMLNEGESICQK